MKDYLGVIGFFVSVLIGALLINSFLLRSFSVSGPSMQPTLETGDRLLVNRIPHTLSLFSRNSYLPERGKVIVFNNPSSYGAAGDAYIVKRVLGLPGERVVVNDGKITVYNEQNPNGFRPDESITGPQNPTTGDSEILVPKNEVFVAGDNRIGQNSLDSRNGLGTVPIINIQGPVLARVFPFTGLRLF